jgi:hypothetical protein
MHSISGGCHCGNIQVDLSLARAPANYHPRACDCSFCRKHGAAYISDAQGSLRIRISEPDGCGQYRQGNELAEMLLCTRCGVLIGALFQSEGRIHATVNVRAVEGTARFGAEQTVSPQVLSADQKVARWKELWFGDVEVHDF